MNSTKIVLTIKGVGVIPAFKNRKRAIQDRNTGKMRTLTEPSIKKRMDRIENAILFALYSLCATADAETQQECLKQLRIALSGLSDDSIRELPQGSWGTEYVKKGEEGAMITIEQL